MTNGQVKDGFSEVYNQFWNKYKKRQPDKESQSGRERTLMPWC